MDPIKFNPFQNVTGAQQITTTDSGSNQPPIVEPNTPALEIDVTPDIDGRVDISEMSLDFEDKLKNLNNQ